MRLAVLHRPDDPISLRIYAENVLAELPGAIDIIRAAPANPLPRDCDLVWEPALAMRRVSPLLRNLRKPLVATIHGVKAFALPLHELEDSPVRRLGLLALKHLLQGDWRWLNPRLATLIAVSEYAATEAISAFHIDPIKLRVIHHGVDRRVFRPDGPTAGHPRPYLLSVSSPNPIKNLPRLFAAHAALPPAVRADLVVIAPGHDRRAPDGVRIIPTPLPPSEIARWYRGATALVFPSLRETFGLPILEAMGCGCPVVTSHDTGCAEIAGPAALRVDPRSTSELTRALARVCNDPALRQQLASAGLSRVEDFSWTRSAQLHLEVFSKAVASDSLLTPTRMTPRS